jgi:SAM-dependent methyltransferase
VWSTAAREIGEINVFSKTEKYYDAIYSFKDYKGETKKLEAIISDWKRSPGNCLLDVACGTGMHMRHFGEPFVLEGLDLDEELLALARQRIPDAVFHHGDMTNFDLGSQFDVITCLFSSIGYVKTMNKLEKAVACMANHLVPGGVLIVEPWFTPDVFMPGTAHGHFIDEPELKIARVNTSFIDGSLSYFDMHYLIGTPEGTDHFVERHELGLFTVEQMISAFETAGLEVSHDPEGLMGRGLYIGRN